MKMGLILEKPVVVGYDETTENPKNVNHEIHEKGKAKRSEQF